MKRLVWLLLMMFVSSAWAQTTLVWTTEATTNLFTYVGTNPPVRTVIVTEPMFIGWTNGPAQNLVMEGITAGRLNTVMGYDVSGGVLAWGDNTFGGCNVPSLASNSVMAIANRLAHSLALRSDSTIVAWGNNGNGQCNIPSAASNSIVAISCGDYFSLAVRLDGSVVGWGSSVFGETSIPSAASNSVVAVSGGHLHSLALRSDGRVVAWGLNGAGQCNVPTSASNSVVAIAAGYEHSLALRSDGRVVTWGSGTAGIVPSGASNSVVKIATCRYSSLALRSDGSVVAWGLNEAGECNVPALASNSVVAIASGWGYSVAVRSDGRVIAWGSNDVGQCNIPSSATSSVVQVTAGYGYTTALRVTSTLGDTTVKGTLTLGGMTRTNWLEADPLFVAWTNGLTILAGMGASGTKAVALGFNANGNQDGIALGENTMATNGGVAIGTSVIANNKSVSVGYHSQSTFSSSDTNNVALGAFAKVPIGMSDTTEIGAGTAVSNGWFHYRGYPIIGPSGDVNVNTLTSTNDGRSVWGIGLSVTNIHGGGGIDTAYGASQHGYSDGSPMTIGIGRFGSSQRGFNISGATMTMNGIGALQQGYNMSSTVLNQGGAGSIQLFNLTSGQTSLVTSAGNASIVLGGGTASNNNSIVAGDNQVSHGDGSITAGGGFWIGDKFLTNGPNHLNMSATSVGNYLGVGDTYWSPMISGLSTGTLIIGTSQLGVNVGAGSHGNILDWGGIGSGTHTIGANSGANLIRMWGYAGGTIGASSYGNTQIGRNGNQMEIGNSVFCAEQRLYSEGSSYIGGGSLGASQYGYIHMVCSATNLASGAMQLLALDNSRTSSNALTTADAHGSLLLGGGIASNRYAIVAGDLQVSHGEASITAGGGFWDNGVRLPTNALTNEPAFIAWTNSNYTALGESASAASYSIAIGRLSSANFWGIAIGSENVSAGAYAIAIGKLATAGDYGTSIGLSADSSNYGISIGQYAKAYGYDNIAIGSSADTPFNGAFVTNSGFADTVEIGRGVATNNGWFHFRGKAIIDSIGNVYAPTGTFSRANSSGGFWDNGTRILPDTYTIWTNSYTINVTNTSVTNFVMTNFMVNTPFILRGRMYVTDTNVFSKTNTVTFSDSADNVQGREYWQADMLLTSQMIASNLAAGSTNVYVQDATGVANNNLVYIDGAGGSNEFVRISKTNSIIGNNVFLKGTNLYPHAQLTNTFNRVAEFSGFRMFNSANTNTMYGTFEFSSVITNVNIKIDIEYSK